MKIEKMLSQHKRDLLKKWFHLILQTYPEETAKFLTNEKDPFTNPVGSTILKGIEELFEKLIKESDYQQIPSFLDRIIHIRATQDFTPSQALSFLFMLKKVIREEFKKDLNDKGFFEELLIFESKIDELGLAAFNLYMECREKIYKLRANEVKNRYSGLLRRLNLVYEIAEEDNQPTFKKSEAQ